VAFKVANTVVINDAGTITGLADGFNVNNQLVFPDPLTPQQGSISGYSSGGRPLDSTIQKFPFTSDTNSSDVGELTQARGDVVGQSSSVSGYTSGGVPSPTYVDTIDKFPFAADASASDVGELLNNLRYHTGQSSSTFGYVSGGDTPPVGGGPQVDTIQKFPFAADANATDVGELTACTGRGAGQSSTTSGYFSGGCDGSTSLLYNQIQKFPFASDTSSTNIGTLSISRMEASGQSSELFGYSSGGYVPESPAPPFGTRCDTIDKFPFSSDASATDVGNLTQNRGRTAGHSSTLSGYASGGLVPGDSPLGPFARLNTIDKFPFAADANATDVGDLLNNISSSAGQQSGGNA